MNEIRSADTKNLLFSLINPGRLLVLGIALYAAYAAIVAGGVSFYIGTALFFAASGIFGYSVRQEWLGRRFISLEHRQLWEMVTDRLKRFRVAMKSTPKHVSDSLQELPAGVERTARTLYESLRRADIVKDEIQKSEGKMAIATLPFNVSSNDPETSELYMLADRNVAEYRKYFEAVHAQVTRTEGQCALFISALDTLRVQLLGYRLATKASKVASDEFVGAVAEVRQQLQSIDEALDELEIGVFKS